MYYEYWGLNKPAFDNVPDPSMYVDCHASMERAIAETIFAIEEGDECMAVIVGDVGLGKTMSIRMIIDTLDQRKYKIALVTNPGISFVQLLQEIIGQLTGTQCEEKRKVNLLETFNGLLFSTIEEGKKVLIFIDEANAISPATLESLRLLTNMQDDRRNLFTMVLAGQIEFARRLENPKRANLFQRVGTFNRIDKLESAAAVRKYVETRLRLAGASREIFTEDACDKIWEHSDQGIPRLINKLSKLCLKAGETNGFTMITGHTVEQISARFRNLTGPVVEKRRARMRVREEAASAVLPDAAPETAPEAIPEMVPEIIPAVAAEAAGDSPITAAEPAGYEEPVENTRSLEEASVEAPEPAHVQMDAPLPADPLPAERDTVLKDFSEELEIGNCRIRIDFPEPLIRQSRASTREHRSRLAGALAAETLKRNPQLMSSYSLDPVPIWQEIRDFVLTRFNSACAA